MAGIKKFFSDFKDFAMKGNIMDMAVGVVIGSAFGKIVTSLVNDIITPFISLLTGSVTLTDLKYVFRPEVLDAAGEVVQAEISLTYGNFIQTCIDFLIIAFSIFVVIRLMGAARTKMEQLKKKEEEAAVEEEATENELAVLQEIRELLKETQKQ